jgi:hypothetical protein
MTFDIVTDKEMKEFSGSLKKDDRFILHGCRGVYLDDGSFVAYNSDVGKDDVKNKVKQPPYNFGSSQVEVFLDVNETYYIIPSLYKRNQPGTFFVHVYADGPFSLGASSNTQITEQPMKIGKSENSVTLKKTLNMTVSQFYAKKELLREKIVVESKRLKLSLTQLSVIFDDIKAESKSSGKGR